MRSKRPLNTELDQQVAYQTAHADVGDEEVLKDPRVVVRWPNEPRNIAKAKPRDEHAALHAKAGPRPRMQRRRAATWLSKQDIVLEIVWLERQRHARSIVGTRRLYGTRDTVTRATQRVAQRTTI